MEKMTAQAYFTVQEWEDISNYEKDRLNTKISHFFEMQQLGFDPPLPDFVEEWQAKVKSAAAKRETSKQIKGKKTPSVKEQTKTGIKCKLTVAASQSDGAKKAMVEQVQAVVKNLEIAEERISAVAKLRALALSSCQGFHGFSKEDMASSHAVDAKLKALLLNLEPRFDAACVAYDEVEKALRREDAQETLSEEVAVDGEQVEEEASAGSEQPKIPTQAQERDILETRYSLRQRQEINYEEQELPDESESLDEDEFLFSGQCQREHRGVCPTRPELQFVGGRQLPQGCKMPHRTERTVPQVMALGESSVKEPLPREVPAPFDLSAKLNEPGPEGQKRLKCGDCSYSTDTSKRLNQHVATHTRERRFACTKCEYKAVWKCDLARHLLAHSGVKPHACAVCSYRAARKYSLTRHMRTHTGEKPFKCQQCDFAFNHSGALVNHVLSVHTKERPFGCIQCAYKCVTGGNLARHMLKHSGEKKLSCAECSYKCNQAQQLKTHVVTKHIAGLG